METFITSFTAIVAVYIAYQQWQTSEREIKKDMFHLRYTHFIMPIRDSLNKIYSVLGDKGFNFQTLIQQEIDLFSRHFSSYRYLINEYDAEELRDCYKKLLLYCEAYHNGKYTNDQFGQKVAHTLQNIDEILYSYMYLEKDKCYNILSILKNIIVFLLKLITPIKLQRKLIRWSRKRRAIQKVETMADHNEAFNKTGVDKL